MSVEDEIGEMIEAAISERVDGILKGVIAERFRSYDQRLKLLELMIHDGERGYVPFIGSRTRDAFEDALKINPGLSIFEISCKTGEGLEDWYNWVRERARDKEESQ